MNPTSKKNHFSEIHRLIDKQFSNRRLALLALGVFIFALYAGNILFGESSFEVLTRLEQQKELLEQKIEYLKNENAQLKKEYFELKNLES